MKRFIEVAGRVNLIGLGFYSWLYPINEAYVRGGAIMMSIGVLAYTLAEPDQ